MKQFLCAVAVFCATLPLSAQSTWPENGVFDERSGAYAFTHATIVVDTSTTYTDATMVIRDGIIVSVGTNATIPADAVVVDLQGKYVYPSFIDADADYGLPKKENPSQKGPQLLNNNEQAVSWNQAITPEFQAYTQFSPDDEQAKQYRQSGIGLVLTHRHDGIMRGTGALVFVHDLPAREAILSERVSTHYALRKGSSTQDYPSSQMGSIALIRQTLYDADWYAKGGSAEETNISLEAIVSGRQLIPIFDAKDKLEVLRADQIGNEFNIPFVIKGSGNEYQRVQEIAATGASLIIPVNYPKTPDITDPYDAQLLPLADLKEWEMAPANAAYLADAHIRFCFTANGLEDKSQYLPAVRKAVQYGLSEKEALAALTITPAGILGIQNQAGSLQKGRIANFLITSGNIFNKETVLYENWVDGHRYILKNAPEEHRGLYALQVGNSTYGLLIKGSAAAPVFQILKNTDTLSANGSISDQGISLQFTDNAVLYRLSGWKSDKNFAGRGQMNENWIEWSATFANVYMEKPAQATTDSIHIGEVVYPFSSFGWTTPPQQQNILITNATVWTNEKAGVLKNTDVLIGNGKILQVGKNISAKNALVIDGTGKHVTAGIIDEHSHIAVTDGVNEGTQSSSAEVRMGDVIDCDDINIYRQLSGGVTTAHILHGSANPVGGQTQLIKLRWGLTPEEMKFEGWPGFIKFALGENVKQSNWGDESVIRFPQTRMGVEQVYADIFTRAQEYALAKKDPKNLVRTDLELEAIAEILEGKRFITCHSYVQSEINMLMNLADTFGFTVNTFTHILEGYKVADKMKMHGAGASSFSDWWAYKFEVYDAIPQNAGLLHDAGVITALNSDDAEMARRLNQEAAKTIKYSGISEEEALKMVTLNPAKLLHIDDRTGSIKEGKDADIVLWSDNPLSIYAMAEKTIIDGRIYFDRSQQSALLEADGIERDRIIKKMMADKVNGAVTIPVSTTPKREYDCEDVGDFVKGE